MKRSLALSVVTFILFSGVAIAHATSRAATGFLLPHPSPCVVGMSGDSYGRGIEGGYTDQDLRAELGSSIDGFCYDLGAAEGAKARVASEDRWNRSTILRNWGDGWAQGVAASPFGIGAYPYNEAYLAGRAYLNVRARAGDTQAVGKACVEAYRRGSSDRLASRASLAPLDQPLHTCYEAGYFDGNIAAAR